VRRAGLKLARVRRAGLKLARVRRAGLKLAGVRLTGMGVAGACLAAGIAGCQSGSSAPSAAAASSGTPTAWAPPPPPDGITTLINTGDYRFRTPSGNVTCHVSDLPTNVSARCDIAQFSYPPPPNPGVACPRLDALTVGAEGPGEFTCAPQTPVPAGAEAPSTLAYWDSVQVGRFTCKSKDTGVSCENTQTNHGFELGATAFRRY